jgi:hypothetical protein
MTMKGKIILVCGLVCAGYIVHELSKDECDRLADICARRDSDVPTKTVCESIQTYRYVSRDLCRVYLDYRKEELAKERHTQRTKSVGVR